MRTKDPDIWFGGSVGQQWRQRREWGVEARLRGALRDAMAEFWRLASLRGALLVNRRCDSVGDAARNLVAATTVFCLAIALVSYNAQEMHSRPPLQVNVRSTHAVSALRFPAVAVCTNNVISRTALRRYIRFLNSQKRHNNTYDANEMAQNILHFGAFLTKTLPDVDVLFMDLLQHKDPDFNVSDLMYQLSPKCSSLLRGCAWAGSVTPCSQLFATRITPLGYCCVFNSRYHPADIHRPPMTVQQVGQSSGLIVMYSENDEDYAYVRRPALGVEVLIFDGDEFPLLETGVTRLYPVQRNASMFFSLSLRQVLPSNELTTYSESWRQCRIREERGERSERSSYSWCLLECRRRTMAALCKCVPFFLMPRNDDIVCTPNHLPCLNKHKEKFIQLYPGLQADPGLTEESQDSLDCDCLPDCGRPVYSADVAASSYTFAMQNKFFFGITVPGALANTSVLRFFFNSNHHPLFVVEPSLRWYEGIATIACHWVLLLTVTLVTFAELVFHLTVRWVHHFRRRTRLLRKQYRLSHPASSDSDEDIPIEDHDSPVEDGDIQNEDYGVVTLVLNENITCRTPVHANASQKYTLQRFVF